MRSMTGCGRCQIANHPWEITVELRSVNHRFLDISMRLPRSLSFLEDTIRKKLSAMIRRGHVDVYVTVVHAEHGQHDLQIDEQLAVSYAAAAKQISVLTGCPLDMSAAALLSMDGVATMTEPTMDEEQLIALCNHAVDAAVNQLILMRSSEGENLQADLKQHLDEAARLRGLIAERAPSVVQEYRQRLLTRLKAMQVEGVDPTRIAQEVALMADRCAIDEELSRLQSHIEQMNTYLNAAGEIGKKMDFLIQEMNREANTIGSKASDARIAQNVVNLKSEIEKLREQVQNIE